ncbi:MAG: GNAT family N-acetyltransferase [Parachlamydiaceae bacterium]|nr:GNAT family N-acetyltransferase [Parachlamydiaceae bacterium]
MIKESETNLEETDSLGKDKVAFECVRPIEAHARLIMQWRNDADTLKMSYHSTPKEWHTFFSEFLSDYFCFPDLPPLFAIIEGQRAAFLRFRPVIHPEGAMRRCCDISINVAPELRHKGFGRLILEEIQSWVAQQGYEDLYAEIKKDNAASKNAFLNAGFHEISEGIKEIIETGKQFPIFRLITSLDKYRIPLKNLSEDVFVIAEAGSNWRVGSSSKDIAMSKMLIQAAAEAGADAIKFQVFRPETVYVNNAGTSDYLSDAGIKEDINAIFADLSMPYDLIPQLAAECKAAGIHFMATAFSTTDFAAIDPYVTIHKIASYEIGHIRLLEMAAKSSKPIILSTGAATEDEIAWSVNYLKEHQAGQITLLQCTACYPAAPEAMHLRSIHWLKNRFNLPAGLSDHSRHPLHAPIAAVALGATVIEKHFTMDNALPGPDHAFALEPNELKEMILAIRQTAAMLGCEVKKIDPSEEELRYYARRGLQALCNIDAGELFHEGRNVAILRPGKQIIGVHPKFIDEVEGKAAKRPIEAGEGIQLNDW